MAFERGVEWKDRTLGESYLAGSERPPRGVHGALVFAVGVEQAFGSLIAFAGESGRARVLRHRGLLDDDQAVVDLHRRSPMNVEKAPVIVSHSFNETRLSLRMTLRSRHSNQIAHRP